MTDREADSGPPGKTTVRTVTPTMGRPDRRPSRGEDCGLRAGRRGSVNGVPPAGRARGRQHDDCRPRGHRRAASDTGRRPGFPTDQRHAGGTGRRGLPPHRRGGLGEIRADVDFPGTTPHGRGGHPCRTPGDHAARTTPAQAGLTETISGLTGPLPGLPPHRRGLRRSTPRRPARGGTTPAQAGLTAGTAGRSCVPRDYPRTGGATSPTSHFTAWGVAFVYQYGSLTACLTVRYSAIRVGVCRRGRRQPGGQTGSRRGVPGTRWPAGIRPEWLVDGQVRTGPVNTTARGRQAARRGRQAASGGGRRPGGGGRRPGGEPRRRTVKQTAATGKATVRTATLTIARPDHPPTGRGPRAGRRGSGGGRRSTGSLQQVGRGADNTTTAGCAPAGGRGRLASDAPAASGIGRAAASGRRDNGRQARGKRPAGGGRFSERWAAGGRRGAPVDGQRWALRGRRASTGFRRTAGRGLRRTAADAAREGRRRFPAGVAGTVAGRAGAGVAGLFGGPATRWQAGRAVEGSVRGAA